MKFIFLLFGVVFSGVAIGIFSFFLLPSINDKRVLSDGKTAIAEVIDYKGGSSYNDVPYYSIEFEYRNDEGALVKGKTNASYTKTDLVRMGIVVNDDVREDAVIAIKYLGNNAVAFEYVEEPFKIGKWLFVIIFGAVGVGMMLAFLKSILSSAHGGIIKAKGKDATATYLDYVGSYTVNDVQYYKIVFTFRNDFNELVEAKSKKSYRRREVEAFANMQSFPIKYIGNKATIMIGKQELLEAQLNINSNDVYGGY